MDNNVLDFFNQDIRVKQARARMYNFLSDLLNSVDFEEIDTMYEEIMCELEGFDFEPEDNANDNEGE